MTKFSKTFLVVAVATFALSFIPPFREFGWGILRPLGAVSFIIFFLSHLLAKEMELFAQDHAKVPQPEPAPEKESLPARGYPPRAALAK